MGRDGFRTQPMMTRAVEKLIGRYVTALGLEPLDDLYPDRENKPRGSWPEAYGVKSLVK